MMANSNVDQTSVSRCPECGQRLEQEAIGPCPLCGFDFGAKQTATSDDTTPFAESYSREESGHRRMWKWVWGAKETRLKHLALMRASAAARSFSFPYYLLLAAALGLLLSTHFGWRAVTASAAIEESGSTRPLGKGWLHVASMPHPYRVTQPPATPVDLWWNAPQAIIAAVAGFVSALLFLWFVFALLRAGFQLAHRSVYRGAGRMTAALHYSAAWAVPLLCSGVILLVRPFARLGPIARWAWYPSRSTVDVLAGFVAVISLVFWWFWLFRLASTAPADTRGRVAWFAGLAVPLIVGAAAAAWWLGMHQLLTQLFDSWKLRF